jgi:transposase
VSPRVRATGRRLATREVRLKFKGILGKEPKLSGAQIKKIYGVATQKNLRQLQFEFALWTRSMVPAFIRDELCVRLSETSVGRLLRRMGLTPQRPLHRAYGQDPKRIEQWLPEEYPKIRRRAQRKGPTSTSATSLEFGRTT